MIFSSTLVTLVLLLNKKSCWETIHLPPTHHRQSIRRSSALVPAVWAQARLGCRSRRATRRSPNRLPGSSTMASVAGKGECFFFSKADKHRFFCLVRNMKQVLFMESWQLQGMDLGDFWWDWWLKHIETMLTVGRTFDLMALKWEFYGILLHCWMDRTVGMTRFVDDCWHIGLFHYNGNILLLSCWFQLCYHSIRFHYFPSFSMSILWHPLAVL